MHLVSFNIQYGKGRDGTYDLQRTADAVARADIICLQEVERHWDRSGNVDQVKEVSDLIGGTHYWVYGPTVDIHKAGDSPARNRRRQFGNMVLSRWPILWSRRHLLPKQQLQGHFTIQRGVVEAVVDAPSGLMRVYSTHLCHLSPETRLRQVEAILAIHDGLLREGPVATGPHPDQGFIEEPRFDRTPDDAVVMGDMNFAPGSIEYGKLVGEESIRGELLVHAHRFVDAALAAEQGAEATFYRDFEAKDGARIDHCFVTVGIAERVERVEVDRNCVASDHQPVHVHLGDNAV